MRHRSLSPLSTALAALAVAALAAAVPAGATGVLDPFRRPLEPPSTGGVERVDRALAKLAVHRRLLVVGAHPDDEDTTLLALVARGLGGEAAYLSLSRGEGGQNLIGPELGPALGLIRSRELLAAREIDGARQFFTRAYDFGYTRSIDETLELWPREVLLEDAVRVIRRFRPQVIVSVFPPDGRGGHGQHQASGIVAGEAYRLAGDPDAFPELAAEGLAPWSPEAFYRASWWDPEAATARMPTGVLEPYAGRSVLQLAMASRSLHRSQDMGMLQPIGPSETRLAWVEGGAGPEGGNAFAGIDTRLAAIAAGLPDGDAKVAAATKLALAEDLVLRARARLSAAEPSSVLLLLAETVEVLRSARRDLDPAAESGGAAGADGSAGATPGAVHAAALLDEKIALAEMALAAAAGVAVDAVADRVAAAPGDAWSVEAMAWLAAAPGPEVGDGAGDPAAAPAVELLGVELVSPAGIELTSSPLAVEELTGWASRFRPNPDPEGGYHVHGFRVALPAGAAPTVPYFLERPLDRALYDGSAAPAEVRGEPFGPPPLAARFRLRVAGVELALDREVVHRFRDQATGEVRQPLRVVPAIEVALAPDLLVWPVGRGVARELAVTLTNRTGRAQEGGLAVEPPAGWPRPEPVAFRLAAAGSPGDSVQVEVSLAPPDRLAPGDYRVEVAALVAVPHPDGDRPAPAPSAAAPGGAAGAPRAAPSAGLTGGPGGAAAVAAAARAGRYELALPVVDYPHIRATPYPEPAVARVAAAAIELPPLRRVGYVRGASDRVPELLAEIGAPVELLGAEQLLEGDLSVYDAIVVGSRAYEIDPALARANGRLIRYAEAGGLVVVQYQQYQFVEGGFAPYPLEIARPHGRVTDETAPVRPLDPAHPVFHEPNEIGAADWEGWVQERGLYFPATWDAAYRPLLATADPGQDEQRGALLVAPVGRGTWVYTGLAFFRQLPAGVPGAYRLFANLLAL